MMRKNERREEKKKVGKKIDYLSGSFTAAKNSTHQIAESIQGKKIIGTSIRGKMGGNQRGRHER